MSQIFDALQRAEAERNGKDTARATDAAELLERAERQAAYRREAIVAFEAISTPPLSEADAPAIQEEPSLSTLVDALAEPFHPEAEKTARILEQFPSVSISPDSRSRLITLAEGAHPAAEAFRLLAVRLRHRRKESTLRKLLITSTIPEEGKSLVSANVSCAMASGSRQKVVLLEGDIRRPSLAKVFGIERKPGLSELIQGSRNLASSVYRVEQAGIWLLPAGTAPKNPLEVLQSNKVPVLLEQLMSMFDWVIIDSPPILPLADTSVWARLSDGIVLVTRPGVTKKKLLEKGLEAIEKTKLVGALMNSYQSLEETSYYYYGAAAESSDS